MVISYLYKLIDFYHAFHVYNAVCTYACMHAHTYIFIHFIYMYVLKVLWPVRLHCIDHLLQHVGRFADIKMSATVAVV